MVIKSPNKMPTTPIYGSPPFPEILNISHPVNSCKIFFKNFAKIIKQFVFINVKVVTANIS